MIVYRAINDSLQKGIDDNYRNEFLNYCNGKISIPNKAYYDGFNTFSYDINKNYLHFFKFKEDCKRYILEYLSKRLHNYDSYVCYFDIPKTLLTKYKGYGSYCFGYLNFTDKLNGNIPIMEYAIPFLELNNDFIVGKVEQYNPIWLQEMFFNLNISDEYLTYYKNEHHERISKEEYQRILIRNMI